MLRLRLLSALAAFLTVGTIFQVEGRILQGLKFDGNDTGISLNGAIYTVDGDRKVLTFDGKTTKPSIPAVKFQQTSFTIKMQFKPKQFNIQQTLIGDWTPYMQFLIQINKANEIECILRKNSDSKNPSDPSLNLINIAGGNVLAKGQTTQLLIFAWNRVLKRASIFLNGELVQQETTSFYDIDLQNNTHTTYQLGWKGDTNDEVFKGDMRGLDIFSADVSPYNPYDKRTVGGNGYSQKCKFPFVYGGKTYYNCTLANWYDEPWDGPWCSTQREYLNGGGRWGYCGAIPKVHYSNVYADVFRIYTGKYSLDFDRASTICKSFGARLAMANEIKKAITAGMSQCKCGWGGDHKLHVGATECKEHCYLRRHLWDAYCYFPYQLGKMTKGVFWVSKGRYRLDFNEAIETCMAQGATVATPEQLTVAWEAGMDQCNCGWLSNKTVKYPINTDLRSGCGGTKPGIRTCSWQHTWDVYCYMAPGKYHTGKSYRGVFWVSRGRYTLDYPSAEKACAALGARVSTPTELTSAYKRLSMNQCNCGWSTNKKSYYPITTETRIGCGGFNKGIRRCTWQNKWDTYCSKYVVGEKTNGVFHVGTAVYTFDYAGAEKACQSFGATVATLEQLTAAWKKGMDSCACGFTTDKKAHYPITKPRKGCGTSKAGIRNCTWEKLWDAYCYKL